MNVRKLRFEYENTNLTDIDKTLVIFLLINH